MFSSNKMNCRWRRILVVILLCFVATVSTSCAHEVQTYHDKYVSAGELHSPFEILNPHMGGWSYIKVNGKTYKKVCGVAPFYLKIPELDSILFVTGDEKKTFHIFNLKTKREIAIPGGSISFGGNIGAPRKPGEPLTDWVESANTNEIVLASQGLPYGTHPSVRILITINLKAKKMEKVEAEYHDKDGKLVREPFK
jgi:hypothetical protein